MQQLEIVVIPLSNHVCMTLVNREREYQSFILLLTYVLTEKVSLLLKVERKETVLETESIKQAPDGVKQLIALVNNELIYLIISILRLAKKK